MMTPRSGPPSSVAAGSVAAMAAAASRMTLKVPTRLIWMTRLKRFQRQDAVAPQHLAGRGDPGAVHHDPQRPQGRGGVDGGLHLCSLVTSAGTKTAVLPAAVPASPALPARR